MISYEKIKLGVLNDRRVQEIDIVKNGKPYKTCTNSYIYFLPKGDMRMSYM